MEVSLPFIGRRLFAPLALFLAGCVACPDAVRAQEANANDGLFVTVPNPITEGAISQIKTAVEKAKASPGRNIKRVIFDFNPEGKEAATESYGPPYELAVYIRSLVSNGITPTAFVHAKTTRHTVLPVIACEERVISSGATIGDVPSKERPVAKNELDYYIQLAGINHAGAVARMIDKDVVLVQALNKGGTIYVDLRKTEGPGKDPAYDEVRVVNRNPVQLPSGPALYNTEQARRFELFKVQLETRPEIATYYQLPTTALEEDPIGPDGMRPCKIMIEGLVDVSMREKLRRQIEAAKARKENYFFFVIECEGGDSGVAREIADDIINLAKDPNHRSRTIAFVPGQPKDLAVFLAFACQERVMFKGPRPEAEATLGDFTSYLSNKNKNENFLKENLLAVSEQRGIPAILIEGLFDRNLEIIQARNAKTGETKLMSDIELKQLAGQGWAKEGTVIKQKNSLLVLNATTAKNLRIASTVDNKDVTEVYAKYGVEAKTVRDSEPSWLDNFAAFLRSPGVSIFLIIVGIAGLVLEMKAPGLIVPGVISAVCFILFFWAQTQLGGQLIYLAIMLFLLGLVLLAVEIFLIPGFGVTGVSGILLILGGLVLAGLDKAPESTADWIDIVSRALRYGLMTAGSVLLAFFVSRFLPKIPYANRLMLVPPEDKIDADADSSPLPGVDSYIALLGQVGTTTSMLRPAGMAKFADRYVDVISEGDFIDAGTPVQVVEVEGTRVVVKRV
ncbi:NfeD family protein [Zavarzinella formosa]|uniref:NfeD family protein n=1 Tax=Zavarzinella formosa TaxID=360055 RepID=UPI0002E8AC47|nr:NfeD family protein [Zavarzinella formosa]